MKRGVLMVTNYGYRPTKAVIDTSAIQNNVQSLKKYLHEETAIIAVVKADGYGHGIVEVARAALQAGAKMISVATPDEAVVLREHGVESNILVMAPSPVSFAEVAADLGIAVTVSSTEWLAQVAEIADTFKKPLKIHVKIDSGMGRVGVRDKDELQQIIQLIEETDRFELDGVFTHFPCADESDSQPTNRQQELFMEFVKVFPEKPKYVHVANSATTLLYPAYQFDAVRFGISLYGIAPSSYVQSELPFPLQSALSIESELSFVKKVEKGQSISYGATYTTEDEEWIGTIPMGYADGLKRGLRGQEVLIEGERMPLVGTICMDQCMVRLPRKLAVGTPVTLIGRQGEEEVTVEEWAERMDTIPYEIVVTITKRVPRVYVNTTK